MDFIAKRYGKLPSEALAQATTIDLWVMEIAVGYENWINDKHSRGESVVRHNKTDQELAQMLAMAKQQDKLNANKDI